MWPGGCAADPVIGHFTQADSIIPEPGKASAFDRYAYVLNNPVKYNDPSGHSDAGACGPGDDCDKNPRLPYTPSNTNSEREVEETSVTSHGLDTNNLLFSIKPVPPPTSFYTTHDYDISPNGPFYNDQFKYTMDYVEKIAIPALSVTDFMNILDKGYKITNSGEFKLTKGTLPLGYLEALVAGFRQGYIDYSRTDLKTEQKVVRVIVRGGEAYATDALSTIGGGLLASALGGTGPVGIGAGYVIGSVSVSYGLDWASEELINPWFFKEFNLGEK